MSDPRNKKGTERKEVSSHFALQNLTTDRQYVGIDKWAEKTSLILSHTHTHTHTHFPRLICFRL